MQNLAQRETLLDAMVLLEVATGMYPSTEHFFKNFSKDELLTSAHDLVHHAYDNGASPLEDKTREALASLEASRRYMDLGGHLWAKAQVAEEAVENRPPTSSMLHRVLKRIGLN